MLPASQNSAGRGDSPSSPVMQTEPSQAKRNVRSKPALGKGFKDIAASAAAPAAFVGKPAPASGIAPEWAKPGPAGQVVGVGRTTIYHWMWAGKIRTARVGKCRLVNLESLRAYVDSLAEGGIDSDPPVSIAAKRRAITIRQHVG